MNNAPSPGAATPFRRAMQALLVALALAAPGPIVHAFTVSADRESVTVSLPEAADADIRVFAVPVWREEPAEKDLVFEGTATGAAVVVPRGAAGSTRCTGVSTSSTRRARPSTRRAG